MRTVQGLVNKSNNPRFAYDCYRRFIQMYGDVVMGVQPESEHEHEPFDEVMDNLKNSVGVERDNDLTEEHLKELIKRYKALIKKRTNSEFPQDVWQQLWGAVGAVFRSWQNDRALVYRQKYHIPAEWGTAVSVQTMVFGNLGEHLGDRRSFHPRSGQWRKSVLWRIPYQCSGGRRSRRSSHTQTHRTTR